MVMAGRSSMSSGAAVVGDIVRRAVESRSANPQAYNDVLRQLRETLETESPQEPNAAQSLCRWLESLRYCVSSLDRRATEIVEAVLGLAWPPLPSSVLRSLSRFLIALVSAHSVYGQTCVHTAVRQLADPAASDPDACSSAWVLDTLKGVVNVSPTLLRTLGSGLRKHWPHRRQKHDVQKHFLQKVLLLTTSDYLPRLREEVLCLAMEELVKLDVTVRDDPNIGEEDDEDEDEEQTLFHVDTDEDMGAQAMDERGDGEGTGDEEEDEETMRRRIAAEAEALETPANKLDTLLVLLLEFVREHVQLEPGPTFEALWKGFERSVLPTYQSHHVQYLLFYACSFHPSLSEQFVFRLVDKAMSMETPLVTQQAAVAYVASFLSRAKFVPFELVKQTVEQLAQGVQEYIRTHQVRRVAVSQHLSFYARCQAIFYLLCFRCDQFCESEDGTQFLRSLGLDNVVASRFNPLKECQVAVVQEFARVMNAHQIVYCDSVIKRNSGQSVMSHQTVTEDTKVPGRLEDFFPYDPCFLKKSLVFIEPHYVTWQSRVGDDDSDDEEPPTDDASDDDFLPGSLDGGREVAMPVGSVQIPVRQKRRRLDRGEAITVDPGFFGSPLSPLNDLGLHTHRA